MWRKIAYELTGVTEYYLTRHNYTEDFTKTKRIHVFIA